jgi:AraC family transcriptional regulator, transcriptional activator for feuABC-ybbA operon
MINELFFHIHYCNGRRSKDLGKFMPKISRSLQHHELIYTCAGTGSFKIENKRYLIKKGVLLYIAPNTPYSIEMDDKILSDFLTVHFSYAGVGFNDGKWSVTESTSTLPLQPSQELQEAFPVEEQFQKLVDNWNAKMPGYEFATRTILQQLLITITQNLNKHSRNYAASLKIEKIIRFMHQNLNGKIALSELAELVSISPFYMSKIFKSATGNTVIEYFNKLKIDRSKELLIEDNKKIKEVAQELGFVDEFYFSRMFKKAEGVNPSEFCSKIVHQN